MRLNKYLAQAGVASRRQADRLIQQGQIRVDGVVVTTLGTDIDVDAAVEVGGVSIAPPEAAVIYLLHKPKGVISASSDDRGRATVVDLIRDTRRLYPVGRLDRDTTGALLITNRGDLTYRLTHPSFGIVREYQAEVRGQLPSNARKELAGGLTLDDGIKVAARVKQLDRRGGRTVYQVVLTEGKNREIKRIFRHYHLPLLRLHRTLFAGLKVDNLAPGKYRRLSVPEIDRLIQAGQSKKTNQHA